MLGAATIVCAVVAISALFSRNYTAIAQKDEDRGAPARLPAGETAGARRSAMASTVGEMLKGSGIEFDRSSIDNDEATGSNIYHVRFETSGDAGGLEALRPTVASLRLESKSKMQRGAIRQQRSFELSEFDVVVFAVNTDNKVVWWEIKPDPRVVRAETSDAAGNLSGGVMYRPSPDMLISVPTGRGIEKLHIFSPVWDGTSFSLQALGSVKVEGN